MASFVLSPTGKVGGICAADERNMMLWFVDVPSEDHDCIPGCGGLRDDEQSQEHDDSSLIVAFSSIKGTKFLTHGCFFRESSSPTLYPINTVVCYYRNSQDEDQVGS